MKIRNTVTVFGALLFLCSNPAWTQEEASDDPTTATIRLMSSAEADLPDAVTKEIKLPENLAEDAEAATNAARGLATANQNRLEGNQASEKAEEAQQRGAEMAEAAQDNRENRGRSYERPDPPDRSSPDSQ
jgi:hypothetical protein